MAMRLRTLVVTIMYDDARITDPVEWVGNRLTDWRSDAPRYCIIGLNSPTRDPELCHGRIPDRPKVPAVSFPAMPTLNANGGVV